ncbi:MAG: hypothetical protein K0B16_04515 [Burkholderiaceae bacterium]|nr:hypothetical protein [Burkholderiaceae bacterium]
MEDCEAVSSCRTALGALVLGLSLFGCAAPIMNKVVQAWARYFTGSQAPFSWQPETVEVLATGQLALSTGPVLDAGGKLIATFTSIWRLEAPGTWRIVFDKGNEVCQ